ncbi:hypothetical protein Y030_6021 [Burkholderia pseudomallei MSHR332]|nr:hypothetical protein Y030_6021 [Burkholderia pseudomallei MSHR332]
MSAPFGAARHAHGSHTPSTPKRARAAAHGAGDAPTPEPEPESESESEPARARPARRARCAAISSRENATSGQPWRAQHATRPGSRAFASSVATTPTSASDACGRRASAARIAASIASAGRPARQPMPSATRIIGRPRARRARAGVGGVDRIESCGLGVRRPACRPGVGWHGLRGLRARFRPPRKTGRSASAARPVRRPVSGLAACRPAAFPSARTVAVRAGCATRASQAAYRCGGQHRLRGRTASCFPLGRARECAPGHRTRAYDSTARAAAGGARARHRRRRAASAAMTFVRLDAPRPHGLHSLAFRCSRAVSVARSQTGNRERRRVAARQPVLPPQR